MAIIVALACFTLLFWLMHRRTGSAFLATIAGVTIYQSFGQDFINFFTHLIPQAPQDVIQNGVYLALVVGFPIILYINSSNGGLFGILRLAESVIFAALIVSLISPQLTYIFSFDQLSHDINNFIGNFRNTAILVGAILAYVEILLTKD